MTTRNLCYQHHCQEFDKLPNHDRHLAADWRTVAPCEMCEVGRDALRAALRMALPMLEEYRKWLVDDAIARGDVLEGEAWDELDMKIEQARAALDAADERSEE